MIKILNSSMVDLKKDLTDAECEYAKVCALIDMICILEFIL